MIDVIVGIISLALSVAFYIRYRHGYWKRKGVPFIEPTFLLGNLETFVGGQGVGIITGKFYNEFKRRGVKFGGAYLLTNPVLVPVDLELIKCIMTKDSQYFINRGVYYNEKYDPLAPDLFNIGGERWKNVRVKISPNYTSGKMKAAFETMLQCCRRVQNVLDNHVEEGKAVDIKEIFCCYTTDVNFLCSFGFECNSLENPEITLRRYGKKFFETDLWKELKHTLSVGMPQFSRNVGIVTRTEEVSRFWRNLFLDAVKYRESNRYVRDDLLQMLINMKDEEAPLEPRDGRSLTLDEVAAHALLFFIASFETSSSAMTFCMYEIAKDGEVQGKLRSEIVEACKEHGGELTYEAVMNMKYLRQVVDESMRKYPPIPTLNRECVKDYRIPGTDVVIEKGTSVLISAIGLHHDSNYFPDGQKFDPERFRDGNRGNIPSHAHLPFGEGPRNCVGLRFGLLQVQLSLAAMLRDYEFSVNKKTGESLILNPKSFILSTINDIWLDVRKTEK